MRAAPEVRTGRRRFLRFAAASAGAMAWPARAQVQPPIADMHSHYGLITRRGGDPGLAEDMRRSGVALVAWKLVADGDWLRAGSRGIEVRGEPRPGQLALYFNAGIDRMLAYVRSAGLRLVRTPADVDACMAGEPGIVLASEGADFLEGRVEGLEAAHARGLRHLQFVHYIPTPVGDLQTASPRHAGLSAMGRALLEACNARGILVDLAHASAQAVEQALEVARAPLIWSHSWVEGTGGSWQDPYGYQQRRLSVALARRIADRGGVVGLWGLGLSRPGADWPLGPRDTAGYARELVKLAQLIGDRHVGIGSDIEGVGPNWVLNDYGHVRAVVAHLQAMKVDAAAIERMAGGNYARVLKAAMGSAR